MIGCSNAPTKNALPLGGNATEWTTAGMVAMKKGVVTQEEEEEDEPYKLH